MTWKMRAGSMEISSMMMVCTVLRCLNVGKFESMDFLTRVTVRKSESFMIPSFMYS